MCICHSDTGRCLRPDAARFAEREVHSLAALTAMPKEEVRAIGMKVLEERRFLRSRAAIGPDS